MNKCIKKQLTANLNIGRYGPKFIVGENMDFISTSHSKIFMKCMLSSADSVYEQASGCTSQGGEELVERGVRGQSPSQSTLILLEGDGVCVY